MDAQLALLQFVALALPAVAILMQAVVGFHDRYDDSSSDGSLRIEFRILEVSFLTLVAAGGFFAVSIFQQTTSVMTRVGISLLAISLFLIFPATWFTLRRADFPKQSYETPEEWVKSGGKTVLKYSIVVSPVIVLAIGSQFITIPVVTDVFSGLGWQRIITAAAGVVSSLGIVVTYLQYTASKLDKKRINDWKERVRFNLADIQTRISDIDIDDEKEVTRLKSVAEDSIKDIEGLSSSRPTGVDNEVSDGLNGVKHSLAVISELCDKRLEIAESIESFIQNREEAVHSNLKAEARIQSDVELSDQDLEDELRKQERSEDYIDKVNKKLEDLESEREELTEDLEQEITILEEQIDELDLE